MRTFAPGASRLRPALAAVAGFEARNRAQEHIQGLLLAMISHMAANCCARGQEEELQRWWVAVEAYFQVLESPRLLERGGQKLMNKALELPWAKLQESGVVGRLLKRRRSGRQRRVRRQTDERPPRQPPPPLLGEKMTHRVR